MIRRLATGRGLSRRLTGLGKESEITRVRERVGD